MPDVINENLNDLVEQGLQVALARKLHSARLAQIQNRLEESFPKEKTEEELVCGSGRVIRRVENT